MIINKILPQGAGICYQLFLKERVKEDEEVEDKDDEEQSNENPEDETNTDNAEKDDVEEELQTFEDNFQNQLLKQMVHHKLLN